MASPFRVFRKYQKTLLAVAGVVLMVVFVLGDPLSAVLRSLGGPGARPDVMEGGAVAVRWDGGELTNNELGSLVMQRRILNDFLRGIEMGGQSAVTNAGGELQPLRVQRLIGPEMPQQGVEQDVVRMKLFADIARRTGMSVSDENINYYLQQLGRGRVSAGQIRAMLTQMRFVGRGVSQDYIFEGLREAMLANNYLASYGFALATVLPEQRWQDWLQANDRVVVEAAALPVASYLVDVPEPTDAELSEFFDLYDEVESGPDFLPLFNMELPSARPGFAIPQKVDIHFVRAGFEQLLSKMEAEVTEKDIQDYYDANKQYFIRADNGLSDGSSTSDEAGADTDEQAPAGGETGAAPVDETPSAAGSPGAADAGPAQPSNAAQPSDAATPSGNDGAAPASEDGSRLDRPSQTSPFRLTALEENVEPPVDGSTPVESDADADAATAAAAPSTGAAPAEPSSGPLSADAPAAEAGQDAAATSGEPPVEYQSLDEVRDQIRLELASQKVREQLISVMTRLKGLLNAEFSTYFGTVLDAKAAGKEPPSPPAALADLSVLAKENGLEYGETGPVSGLELRELPLGKSVDADTSESLLRMMFGNELELYQPVTTFDIDNNRYLAMKVSETPRRVPKLSEVREEVVRAWKLQKAADLAETHAKELAAKIEKEGATLKDYFAGDSSVSVDRTDPFAALTIGDVSRSGMVMFRLSEPAGIVAAGPDFMHTVFELDDNQVGAVLNHNHSIAYVVRIVEHQDTPEGLRKAFLAEADQWYGLPTMFQIRAQTAKAALGKSLREAANVHWERLPDQVVNRDEDEE
jgi:hypothetical protein